jgi:hypothetical protein
VPGSYLIDVANRLVVSRVWGVVAAETFIAHARGLAADSRFEPSFRQIADLREIARAELSAEDVRQIAEANPFGPGARRAVVVGADVIFGLARMYEQLADQSPDQFRVFRDYDEAVRWLGLPEGWTPPPLDRADAVFGATSVTRA